MRHECGELLLNPNAPTFLRSYGRYSAPPVQISSNLHRLYRIAVEAREMLDDIKGGSKHAIGFFRDLGESPKLTFARFGLRG
jgi:hypothetical protein